MNLDDRNYYRKLSKKSRRFAVRMDQRLWCDLYHQHFDMPGKGNEGRVHRTRHLNALLTALCRARIELAQLEQPHQLFAYVDLKNSGNDALYVHTPNPNGTPFPSPIEAVSTPAAAPPLLAARIDSSRYEVRRYNGLNTTIFYVIPRAESSSTSSA